MPLSPRKGEKTNDSKLLPACFFPKFREGTFLSPMLKYWRSIAAYPKAQWEITILRLPLMAKDLRRIRWWTSHLIVTSLLIVVGKKAPFLGWFCSAVGAKIFSGVCRRKWSASPAASATQPPCRLSSLLYNQAWDPPGKPHVHALFLPL